MTRKTHTQKKTTNDESKIKTCKIIFKYNNNYNYLFVSEFRCDLTKLLVLSLILCNNL